MKHEDYPMPALTDAQREEAVNQAERDLRMYTSDSHRYLQAQIALAALTADNEGEVRGNYWVSEDDRGTHYWIDWVKNEFPAKGTKIYTAPPVPALNLPDEAAYLAFNNSSDCPLAGVSVKVGSRKAWDACIAEVKRLNGVTK